MASIKKTLNPRRRHRTYPRVIKRRSHNAYPAKKPAHTGTRHDSPPTIRLTRPRRRMINTS
jgi:hypothetical protein